MSELEECREKLIVQAAELAEADNMIATQHVEILDLKQQVAQLQGDKTQLVGMVNQFAEMQADRDRLAGFVKGVSELAGHDPDAECSLCMGELQQEAREALQAQAQAGGK